MVGALGKPMAADELLNVLFYVPTKKDLLANGLMFLCAAVLAAVFHYFPVDPATLGALVRDPASSLHQNLLALAIGGIVNYAIIFFAIDKFFLNSKESASAALGTTVLICLLYAVVWGGSHLHDRPWTVVLAWLHARDVRPFVVALRAGSILACLSSVPLKAWTFLGNQEFLDFSALRKAAPEWKNLVKKIEDIPHTGVPLTAAEGDRMNALLAAMLAALAGVGRRQPVARRDSPQLEGALRNFQAWFAHEAVPSAANINGLGAGIREDVRTIRQLS
jgi:hypothetical protein